MENTNRGFESEEREESIRSGEGVAAGSDATGRRHLPQVLSPRSLTKAATTEDQPCWDPSPAAKYHLQSNPRSPLSSVAGVEEMQIPAGGKNEHLKQVSVSGSDEKPLLAPQLFAALSMTVNGIWSGFVFGFSAVGFPSFQDDPDRPFDLTDDLKSFLSSSFNLGQFFGALLSGPVSRKFGRRRLSIILLLPLGVSWGLIAYPANPTMMVSGRVIQGVLYGVRLGLTQMYMAEVAHVSVRGLLLSTLMTTVSLGQLLCYVVGSVVNWRILGLVAGAVPLVFIPLFIAFLPESPVWLIQNGEEEDALKVLRWLRGPKYDSRKELEEIKLHVDHAAQNQGNYRDVLNFQYLRPFLLALLLVVCRQFAGYYPVTFFTVDIFRAAGSAVDPNAATIIVGSVSLLFHAVSAATTDRLGRRLPALGSAVVMTAAHAALGVHFFLDGRGPGWLPLAALMAFVAAFATGFSNLVFVLIGEIIPMRIKGLGTGVALATNTLSQFVILQTFGDMRAGLGDSGTFWLYGGVSLVLVAVCGVLVPETKGKSLRDIEENLTSGKNNKNKAGVD